MLKVCAVVVTYNRLDMLKRCLSALREQSAPCDVLVVDNASTDGTAEWLNSPGDRGVFNLSLPENTGGAGGFNAGAREALLRGYDGIWLMDDDTLPRADALEKLLEADALLRGEYGWLSSVALWTDGVPCRMNLPRLHRRCREGIQWLRHGIVRASQATFVSLFVRRETFLEAGLPIRDFWIWGDDIEFTRRLAVRMELPCYVAGQSVVVHAMKENTGSNIATDGSERLDRYNLAFRNENYLYRQEGVRGFCYYVARCGKYLLCALFRARDHRLRRCGIILRQMFCGLWFNPRIEYPGEGAPPRPVSGRHGGISSLNRRG